jgi:multimeric flavodoxin WrbA
MSDPVVSLPRGRRFLFLLASARRQGNSESLARQAAANLPLAVGQDWLRLGDLTVPPFIDRRHESSGTYVWPSGDERRLLDATLNASDLVFVAPLYWYGLPANAKLYLDHWSGWLRVEGLDFKARMAGKRLWAITSYSGDDPRMAEPLFDTLRFTGQYMRMIWGGSLLATGNRPEDIGNDASSMARAAVFFAAAASEPVSVTPSN